LVNIEKTNMWPWEWLASEPFPSKVAREHYVVQNDLDLLPESIDRFLEFYAARRARIERRLRNLLGVTVDERDAATLR
jgi:hypothetical protein